MTDTTNDDRTELIYGDGYGEIDIETLGERNGTTTRKMSIPDRLARSFYEKLRERFEPEETKYVVYGTADYSIANVCIVIAESGDEAIKKASDEVYIGEHPQAKPVDKHPMHGDVWSAVA